MIRRNKFITLDSRFRGNDIREIKKSKLHYSPLVKSNYNSL